MLRMFIVDINFYDLHNLHKISFHPLSSSTETPLSSSTESEALRIGDPAPPVIPHLMRDLFRLDSRFRGNDTPFVILSLTGDPVLSGFPFSRERRKGGGNDTPFVILNRKPPCHPQPKAKRFGLGIQPFLDSRFRGNDGSGGGNDKGEIRE